MNKKTHNSRFMELQDEYLKTGDGKYLGMMYSLCIDVASNYIGKYARERGLLLDIPELSHDSAVYVIERYLKKPGFRIERISAYIHFGCIKSLFRNKEQEQREVSIDDHLLNEASLYTGEVSPDKGDQVPGEGFSIGTRAPPQSGRHEPALIRQGLLFEDSTTGKGYEEILM
jgi:hypothetical protein